MEIRIGNLKQVVIGNIVEYFPSYFMYAKRFFRSGQVATAWFRLSRFFSAQSLVLVSGAGGAGNRRAGNLLSLCVHPNASVALSIYILFEATK